jgi:spermidine synthase
MALLFDETPDEVLFIGLGGGTGPKQFLHDYPEVRVRVAEVDPHVVRVAREYFAMPPDGPRLRVGVMDGRQALRRARDQVDAIVVDAYNAGRYGSSIPFHLTTREFFELTRERLTDDGMVVYNVIESLTDAWSADFLRALVKTMDEVFPETYLFSSDSSRNTIVIAVKTARELTRTDLEVRAKGLVARQVVTNEGFLEDVGHLYDEEIDLEEVMVLTDDYAPVDRLLGR